MNLFFQFLVSVAMCGSPKDLTFLCLHRFFFGRYIPRDIVFNHLRRQVHHFIHNFFVNSNSSAAVNYKQLNCGLEVVIFIFKVLKWTHISAQILRCVIITTDGLAFKSRNGPYVQTSAWKPKRKIVQEIAMKYYMSSHTKYAPIICLIRHFSPMKEACIE